MMAGVAVPLRRTCAHVAAISHKTTWRTSSVVVNTAARWASTSTLPTAERSPLQTATSSSSPVITVPHPDASLPPTIVHNNPASQLRFPFIEPKFWTGTNALPEERFTIDCTPYRLGDMAEALAAEGGKAVLPVDLQQRMEAMFDTVGLVVLRNTGLGDNMAAMKHTTEPIKPNLMKYEAGSNSRSEIEVNVFDTGAPKEAYLHYHHEMEYVLKSTRTIAFCCAAAPSDGTGATFVAESIGVTDSLLATPLGAKLRDLGITYIRCLTDAESGLDDAIENDRSPAYNHWQTSMGATTPEEAEAKARSSGLNVEWGPNRFLKTTMTISAFEYFEHLQKNMLYSSAALDSLFFDPWPGVRHLPTMESFATATPYDRPYKITFGDGSDFTREELQTFVDVYDQHGIRLDWNKGDIAVLCNFRFAHGRPNFTLQPGQQRTLGVILGEMFERQGQRDDKW